MNKRDTIFSVLVVGILFSAFLMSLSVEDAQYSSVHGYQIVNGQRSTAGSTSVAPSQTSPPLTEPKTMQQPYSSIADPNYALFNLEPKVFDDGIFACIKTADDIITSNYGGVLYDPLDQYSYLGRAQDPSVIISGQQILSTGILTGTAEIERYPDADPDQYRAYTFSQPLTQESKDSIFEDLHGCIAVTEDGEDPSQPKDVEVIGLPNICGNSICELGEDSTFCNLDCKTIEEMYDEDGDGTLDQEENEEKEDDEDDAIIPDQELKFQLDESVPMITADIVKSAGNRGEGATICLIDAGVTKEAITGGDIGGYFVNKFLPEPAIYTDKKGIAYWHWADTNKKPEYKFCKAGKVVAGSDACLSDVSSGHGTVMASVIASTGVDLGSGIEDTGVAPGVEIMYVKLESEKVDNPLQGKDEAKLWKTTSKAFQTGLDYCLGKNKEKVGKDSRRADVIVVGIAFDDGILYTDQDETNEDLPKTDPFYKQGVLKGNYNVKNIYKSIEKGTGAVPKKTVNENKNDIKKYNPQVIPVIVPAGNSFPKDSSGNIIPERQGLNKLAVLDNTIAVSGVYDAGLSSIPPYSDSLQCSDGTSIPGQPLCNSACAQGVDVAAPAYDVRVPPFKFGSSQGVATATRGTSVAASHVGGVIALMKSEASNKGTELTKFVYGGNKEYYYMPPTVKEIMQVIGTTSDSSMFNNPAGAGTDIYDPSCYGEGIIDAEAAVNAV